MNAILIRAIASKSIMVLAVITLVAGGVAAKPATRGSFDLTSEVRWAGNLLAPGHYTFTLDTIGNPYIITLHRGDDRAVFVMPVGISTNKVYGSSVLVLVGTNSGDAVRTLRLANLDLTLSFSVPRGNGGEEARKGNSTMKEVAVRAER
jgi:hypothetical protein